MSIEYVGKRFAIFFLVVWVTASVNFVIPRLSPANPVRERLLQAIAQGGVQIQAMDDVVKSYEVRFGLDQPLWLQYLRYLSDLARLDLGLSITRFPNKVADMIFLALPWTIVLITVATLIAFAVGTLLGALMAWPKAPRFLQAFTTPLLTLSAIPYYLLGLILIYFFAFSWRILPLGGGYSIGATRAWSLPFILDALRHSILPALSIVLAGMGYWALAMRGMMVTIQGEDYMTFAEAKGLKDRRVFLRYALRNAILPQTTSLALSLGHVVSGSILVEVVFGYPGVGGLLYQAIRSFDYFIIYGVVFILIVAIGLATLILDLILPTLDPRITYQRS
ncbi:MAG: ABC transporter permease [Chloroflexi bacterium]|nr:ABC transporter permease [Chloroflexota bacterium]